MKQRCLFGHGLAYILAAGEGEWEDGRNFGEFSSLRMAARQFYLNTGIVKGLSCFP